MVNTSEQSPREELPEYSWIAKLGEAREAKETNKEKVQETIMEIYYTLEGNKIAEQFKGMFGDRKIVDINTGNTLNLDKLLEGINDPNVRIICYVDKLEKAHSANEIFYVNYSKIGLKNGYATENLKLNTLYLIVGRIDQPRSYHLVSIHGEIPLEDILKLTREYKLEKGNTVLAKCEPACKEPDKLGLRGFVYVGENGIVDICRSPSYLNIKLASPRISIEREETKGYQP
ncbi:MAG: hypothetical protein BXU00_01365 [Candidatus Nanoclepta minutus]|uniref:Uncharacterized protein n=1 Tax=Candidatus Nanoclepta minutus TaxID=1940235 RepID=A0A397WPA0_9ARCH|nr:MAG: hypothetical protein BXU00_01365 [Candidatus Nanoclepta minutus]